VPVAEIVEQFELCAEPSRGLILRIMESAPGWGADDAGDAAQWAHVREILYQALDLPAGERGPYLDQACRGDARLRAEVESLIAASEQSAIIDRPALVEDLDTVTIAPYGGRAAPLARGQKISHYEITGKLGEGGMGAVYRAVDANLGRTVALKVISRPQISAGDKRRFAREAKAASALNHPNIVTIYEYNSEAGVDFIAMEYVEGMSLDALLARHELPLSTLLGYARQVASALAKAHAAGIVHRDLKPANIMIAADGVAKVLDFGLARQEAPGANVNTTALTQAGAVLGTPAYMSPEQAMGEPSDYRSDIFSFGIILYEVACGRRPFQGADALSMARQIAFKDPQPPAEVNGALPAELCSLIQWCLRKKPEDRPQSMAEAAAALHEHCHPLPARSASTPTISRPAVSFPRARMPKWAVWIAVGILTAASGVWWGPRLKPLVQRTAIFAPDSFALYQKATILLKKKYRKEYLDQAIQTLDQAIAANPNHAASYAALAEAYVARFESARDPQWLKLAGDAAGKGAELNPDLSGAQAALGLTSIAQEFYEKAGAALHRALELDPKNSRAHEWLGLLFDRRKQPYQAEAEYRAAMAIAPTDWDPAFQLGRLRYQQQQYVGAVEAWEKARAVSDDHPGIHRNLAAAYHMLNRDEDSAASLQKALEIEPSAAAYNNLGTLRFFQGHYVDAVTAFDKAVRMNASRYLFWGNLADAYRWAPGQRSKAPETYSHAIQLAESNVDKDKDAPGRIALYMAKSGDTAEALRRMESIPREGWDGAMHYRAAVINELAGRRDAALTSLQAALNGGYASSEINNDPELLGLRSDVRFHRLIVPGSRK
jgi:serine/threonine protein kinase/tetratricopeptide (TPR) repeat protein